MNTGCYQTSSSSGASEWSTEYSPPHHFHVVGKANWGIRTGFWLAQGGEIWSRAGIRPSAPTLTLHSLLSTNPVCTPEMQQEQHGLNYKKPLQLLNPSQCPKSISLLTISFNLSLLLSVARSDKIPLWRKWKRVGGRKKNTIKQTLWAGAILNNWLAKKAKDISYSAVPSQELVLFKADLFASLFWVKVWGFFHSSQRSFGEFYLAGFPCPIS